MTLKIDAASSLSNLLTPNKDKQNQDQAVQNIFSAMLAQVGRQGYVSAETTDAERQADQQFVERGAAGRVTVQGFVLQGGMQRGRHGHHAQSENGKVRKDHQATDKPQAIAGYEHGHGRPFQML